MSSWMRFEYNNNIIVLMTDINARSTRVHVLYLYYIRSYIRFCDIPTSVTSINILLYTYLLNTL